MFHTHVKPFWSLVALIFLFFAGFHCRSSPSSNMGKPFSLWLITQLEGTLEPCGCTTHPLGGLAALTATMRQQTPQGPPALVVLGDTFIHPDELPTSQDAQVLARRQLLLQTVDQWAPLAYFPGPRDVASGLLAGQGPLWQRQAQVPAEIIRTAKGPLGLLRWSQLPLAPQAIAQATQQLHQQGVQHVLLLLAQGPKIPPPDFAQTQLSGVMLASDEAWATPQFWDGIPVWSAGHQGMYIGELQIHGTLQAMPQPFAVFDDGTAEQESLAIRQEQLRQAIGMLPDGPAKQARQAMLAKLEQERPAPRAVPTTHSYVRWIRHPIEPKGPQDATVQKAMQKHQQRLCQLLSQQESTTPCPQAQGQQPTYLGNGACMACHQKAFTHYATTSHAKAWKTLQAQGKQCDVTCIACHSVGYMQPGGFCRQQDAKTLAHVGCESCHGPGSRHVQHPQQPSLWGDPFVARPKEAQCLSCHTPEHSDAFDFATYLPRILGPDHGLPPAPAPNP